MPVIPGTTINLRSISGQYTPILPFRQCTYITVHFWSIFPRPCILPPRHYHYATFYIWSVFLKPYTFFTGTTNTLQWIPSQYTLSPIPFLPDTNIILKSISGSTLQVDTFCAKCCHYNTLSSIQYSPSRIPFLSGATTTLQSISGQYSPTPIPFLQVITFTLLSFSCKNSPSYITFLPDTKYTIV